MGIESKNYVGCAIHAFGKPAYFPNLVKMLTAIRRKICTVYMSSLEDKIKFYALFERPCFDLLFRIYM